MVNNSFIDDSVFLSKIEEMSEDKNKIDSTADDFLTDESMSKLTQITFNNFDGEKIQKHNDYIRKSEKEEDNSGDENNDRINQKDKQNLSNLNNSQSVGKI